MEAPGWLTATVIVSRTLTLEPLRVDHAEVLAPLLDDIDIHEFIGGTPATLTQVRERFTRQVVGHSAAGDEGWLNWVVLRADTGEPVGTVQATLTEVEGETVAELAWVIASPHQRQGYAREAATALAAWLLTEGVSELVAHVHPDHDASAAVARGLGMLPTDTITDGEVRWAR